MGVCEIRNAEKDLYGLSFAAAAFGSIHRKRVKERKAQRCLRSSNCDTS